MSSPARMVYISNVRMLNFCASFFDVNEKGPQDPAKMKA